MTTLVSNHAELKSSSRLTTYALILNSVKLQESDKLVHMITEDFGKVAAVAKRASQSLKRFGAGLEPFSLVKAQLKSPRVISDQEHSLWLLESVDLKCTYAHWREDYNSLNSVSAATRLILDHIPEGPVEVQIFRSFGRFLRDSESSSRCKNYEWKFFAFWSWFANFLGFGRIDEPLLTLLNEQSASLVALWENELSRDEPDFKKLFIALDLEEQKKPTRDLRQSIYKNWLQSSALSWPFYERNFLL